jgi:hypothetical protein
MINDEIAAAKPGSLLYKKAFLDDPCENLIRAHVATLEWNMMSRKFGMTAAELVRLQEKSVELLEVLKAELPEKNGVQNAWKFEKAHSILHKVRELILFGWSENFSTQGPEHCHIDFIKKIAHCTNNKEVFLTILLYHVREGHLQYLLKLRADLGGGDEDDCDSERAMKQAEIDKKKSARNDSISCDLGFRYPLLQSIFAGTRNHQTIQASQHHTRCLIRYRTRFDFTHPLWKDRLSDVAVARGAGRTLIFIF